MTVSLALLVPEALTPPVSALVKPTFKAQVRVKIPSIPIAKSVRVFTFNWFLISFLQCFLYECIIRPPFIGIYPSTGW